MLDAMRKGSKTWPAKLLLLVLVLSFGVWGITDYISPSNNTPALTVGGKTFSDGYLRERFNRDLGTLREGGATITVQEAISAGLLNQIIGGILRDSVSTQIVQILDVNASDEAVRQAIAANPAFIDAQGNFNRPALQDFVRQRGLTEASFVEAVRAELSAGYLMAPVGPGVSYPKDGVDLVAGHQSERRTGEALFIDLAKVPEPAEAPKDASVLQALYDDNITLFTRPEQRRASVLVFGFDRLAQEITVTEDDMRARYDEGPSDQAAGFDKVKSQIETELRQERAADLAVSLSQQVEDAIAAGVTLEEASTRFDIPLVSVRLDAFGRGPDGAPLSVLPDEAKLPQTLFALGDGDISQTGKYSGGYYIARVDEIIPAAPLSFDEVRPDLLKAWRLMERRRQADELAQSLQAKIQGGASLESLVKSDRAISFTKIGPVSRFDPQQGSGVAGAALLMTEGVRPGDLPVFEALFAARPDGVQVVSVPKGVALVRVSDIGAVSPQDASAIRIITENTLTESLTKDVKIRFEETLAQKVGYKVNTDRINALFPAE